MRSVRLPGQQILLALLLVCLGAQAWAGGSARREQMVADYTHCDWTDEMGQQLYQCIQDNNGFSTLWCFNTTIEESCDKNFAAKTNLDSTIAQNDTGQENDIDNAATTDQGVYDQAMDREYKMYQFRDCPYTHEMGEHTMECIKEFDGFNAHGCFQDSVKLFCPQEDN